MKKVGIMGGTFNPIHLGHMLIAENAYEAFSLDEILFIPTGNSYMKKNVLPTALRVKMTGLAIEDNPRFAMSTIEAEKEGNSYSCDTIREIKGKYPDNEYYFIVGADSLVYMDTWKNPEEIFANVHVIVASRNSNTSDEVMEKIKEYEDKYNAHISLLPIRNIDISSNEIRSRVKEGKSIRYLVHYKVVEFINKNGLYKDEV